MTPLVQRLLLGFSFFASAGVAVIAQDQEPLKNRTARYSLANGRAFQRD